MRTKLPIFRDLRVFFVERREAALLRGKRDGEETVSGDVTAYSVSSLVFEHIHFLLLRPTIVV